MLRSGTLVLVLCFGHCLAGVIWDVTPNRVQDNETATLNVKLQLTSVDRYATRFEVYIDNFTHPNYNKIWSYDYNFTTWEGQCHVNNSHTTVKTCDGEMMRFEFNVTEVSDVGNLRLLTYVFGAPIGVHWTTLGFRAATKLEIYDLAGTVLKQVNVSAGQKFSMQCEFADGWGNRATFRWLANTTNGSTESGARVEQFTSFRQTAESLERPQHYDILHSEGLKPGDEGTYRCLADDTPVRLGRFQSQTVTLNITYAPQTDSLNPGSETEIKAILGETIKIVWNVMANPKPKPDAVTWSKDGTTISPGTIYTVLTSRGFQYSIQFVAKKDMFGAYECKAQNKLGIANKTFTVVKETQTTAAPVTPLPTKSGTAEPTKSGTAKPTKSGTAKPTKSGTAKPTTPDIVDKSTETPPSATTDCTDWRREYDGKLRDLRMIILVLAIVFAVMILAMALGMFFIYKKMKNLYVQEPGRRASRFKESGKTRKSSRGHDSHYYSNPTSIDYERFEDSEDMQLGIQPPSHLAEIPERPDDGDDHIDTL